jgi:prepilin-type processing-associated H-X9-DG protein
VHAGQNASSNVPNWAYDGHVSYLRGHYDISDLQSGALWPYTGSALNTSINNVPPAKGYALFRCPSDVGPWYDTAVYTVMTTYCANGVMGGWNPTGYDVPADKISSFKASAAIYLWEVGSQAGAGGVNLGLGWDASNGPQDGYVTVRHPGKSTCVAYLDGHVGLLRKEEFAYWVQHPGGRDRENPLWVMPEPRGHGDGGYTAGGSGSHVPTFFEN